MVAIEVQRRRDHHRLGNGARPQREVPIVVVAKLAKAAERLEEGALDEQVACGDGDVVLDEREAVRLRAEEVALALEYVDGVAARRVGVRDEREAPGNAGAGD